MTTTLVPETPTRPLFLDAMGASAAFWIRRAADHLDSERFTDDQSHVAGTALHHALGLHCDDGIDKSFALCWGVDIGLAIAAVTHADPLADHTEAIAAIIAHYRGEVRIEIDHMAEERRRFGR